MSVPDPRKRPGNVACESRRVKPKASLNHPDEPGAGKTGRVNANEPPLRLRNERSSQPMADATMNRPGTRPRPNGTVRCSDSDLIPCVVECYDHCCCLPLCF